MAQLIHYQMRNAVIFTGALRTIRKTIRYFKDNVLNATTSATATSAATTSETTTSAATTSETTTSAATTSETATIDIFICVQNDTSHIQEDWNLWFREEMGGDRVKSIEWFSLEKYPEWVSHRETQLNYINLDSGWKNYLRMSGSMIEYFQLQLAYMAMCKFEQVNGIRYDYVIRARTDSIYAKPLDFHWLNWTVDEVAVRMNTISERLRSTNIECSQRNILMYFMCTMISDDTLPNISEILPDYNPCETDTILLNELTPDTLWHYIQYGRYILTLRKNNMYVIQRRLFHLIPTLGTMYGFMRSPQADDYWFNAEGQFRDACYYSCVSVFDYNTLLEDKSVLSANVWNESDFFKESGIMAHPHMLFCVVRK